jgi:hypothetical protein
VFLTNINMANVERKRNVGKRQMEYGTQMDCVSTRINIKLGKPINGHCSREEGQ